jgi:Domain of unknown function (DUF397)
VLTLDLSRAAWRRSSYSGANGNCVEAAVLGGRMWRKSTYSGKNGSCVEVARDMLGVVAVRDSKEPVGPALTFSPAAWRAFTARVRSGELA